MPSQSKKKFNFKVGDLVWYQGPKHPFSKIFEESKGTVAFVLDDDIEVEWESKIGKIYIRRHHASQLFHPPKSDDQQKSP